MSTTSSLLPLSSSSVKFAAPTPRQVLRICLNLKHLIDKIIPVQFEESQVLSPDSRILNPNVIQLALEAAGGDGDGEPGTSSRNYRSCLIFALLKVSGWYSDLSDFELHDSELYLLRSAAAQQIAKLIIEGEMDDSYLFIQMLCHRYVINENTVDSDPTNAVELAVDSHSITVIGSSGYQRCMKWLWRGWIVQSARDPTEYVLYRDIAKPAAIVHFTPDRIKTPLYQNILEVGSSVIYLFLYTAIINQSEKGVAPLDIFEFFYYFFTIGYIYDEVVKLYHVGYNYLSFWNVFNDFMYAIIICSMSLRFLSLSKPPNSDIALSLDLASFRLFACAAPLMWCRLLLYLDSQRFVGAMIVVMKLMMKESIVFFVLLSIVIVGFLQGFLGLDNADGNADATQLIISNLVRTVLGDGSFQDFERFAPPYANILYYFYNFLVSVILLNILVALYASAYDKIVSNAIDEYMALVSAKTLRYIRAPDAMVYVPPLNLIELFLSPLSWFVSRKVHYRVNYWVMVVIYFPFLAYVSIRESKESRRVHYNRFKGFSDDANEVNREWDLTDGYEDSQFGLFAVDGMIDSTDQNNEDLREQFAAERADPKFNVKKEWFDKVGHASSTMEKGLKTGIGWELYPLYRKIDDLAKLVDTVVKENQSLRKELAQR
jgi:hypothetical protein